MATSNSEVNAKSMDDTNRFAEAPGVWSVMTVLPDGNVIWDSTLLQIRGDKRMLELCEPEVALLSEAKVLDRDKLKPLQFACIFPTRCVIFELKGGGVLCYSPSQILEGMREWLDSMGGVKAFICAHGFNLLQWQEFWPEAVCIGTQNTSEAIKKHKGLRVDWWLPLGDKDKGYRVDMSKAPDKLRVALGESSEDFDIFAIPNFGTNSLVEHDLFHKPTKVLASADMLYNGDPNADPSGSIGFPTKDPVKQAWIDLWHKANLKKHNMQPHLPAYRNMTTVVGLMSHFFFGTGPTFDRRVSSACFCFTIAPLAALIPAMLKFRTPSFHRSLWPAAVGLGIAIPMAAMGCHKAPDWRSQMQAIDAIIDADVQKVVTCHCRKNPEGEDAKTALKNSWAWARELKGGLAIWPA